MNCPKCNHEIHEDSTGKLTCISCNWTDTEPENVINDAGESTSASINDTLKQRGSRYGKFTTQSQISKELRTVIFRHLLENGNITNITPSMEESMILICHKLGRIVNGDPSYDDNWKDIAGYAQLIVDQLHGKDI